MSRLVVRSSDPDVPAMGEGGVFIISRRARLTFALKFQSTLPTLMV